MSIRMGIYAHDGIDDPGDLIVDAGTASVASTGIKEIAITETLDPGLYWLAIVSDSSVAKFYSDFLTTALALTVVAASSIGVYYFTTAHVFAALPDPFGATTRTAIAISPFRLQLKVT